jgi:hypothetical protein
VAGELFPFHYGAVMLQKIFTILLLWIGLFVAAGCRPRGPATYPVSGDVTFDGQPIAQGEILFRAADGASGSWAGKITAGKYSLQSTAGEKRVEITATRQVETVAAPTGEAPLSVQMYIPEKYNTKSELKASVTAQGPNKFDYSLTP